MIRHCITLREALSDPALLGHALPGDSWKKWRTLLIASMGEALTDDEREIFKQLTQRDHEPNQRVEELCVVKGRRAGGSSATGKALIPYLAGLCMHPSLAPGERGILLCVAADQRQADVILDYAEAAFRGSPILAQLVEARIARELRLNNGVTVEVRAADFRRLRGLTFIACVADELAFWMTTEDSSNPDVEILDAIRPGLATTGGPLFLISSPYARKGELWRTYRRHYGATGDPLVLVAQGSSHDFNATLPQSVVDRAYERDPASAAAEFGAEFRKDIEEFISLEAVLACVDAGVRERAKEHYKVYQGFVDPSGGSSDSFTLAIGHKDVATKRIIVDAVREARPPFSPEAVTAEFSQLLKAYAVTKVVGDRYAGEWPREQFSRFGVRYEPSAKPKSDLYLDLLAAINSRRVSLLDHPRLIGQLIGLERRTSRSGRDSIDSAPGTHDDVANCVAGLCAAVINRYPNYDTTYAAFDPNYRDPDAGEEMPAADRRLHDLYSAIDGAIRSGMLR